MNNKPRRPWLAALLTLFVTGLGHMYSGCLKRGMILFVTELLLFLASAISLTVIAPNKYFLIFTACSGIAFAVFCIVDAIIIARRIKGNYEPAKYNRWYLYIGYLVIAVLIELLCTSAIVTPYFVQAFKMPTGSMEPTLLIGDHLLVNKRIYRTVEPKRGDVVVFKYPVDPKVAYVKRLVGLPGDRIEIKGQTVYVNGDPMDEKYKQHINPASIQDHYGPAYIPKKGDRIEVKESAVEVNGEVLNEEVVKTYPENDILTAEPYAVPQDHYFVMGDNRDNSADSRFWGAVPRDYLLGKALVVYWSFETPRGQYLHTGAFDRLKQLGDVFFNFFSKTRWDRIGRAIE